MARGDRGHFCGMLMINLDTHRPLISSASRLLSVRWQLASENIAEIRLFYAVVKSMQREAHAETCTRSTLASGNENHGTDSILITLGPVSSEDKLSSEYRFLCAAIPAVGSSETYVPVHQTLLLKRSSNAYGGDKHRGVSA